MTALLLLTGLIRRIVHKICIQPSALSDYNDEKTKYNDNDDGRQIMETVSGYSQPLLHHQTKVAGYRIPIKTFAYSLYCSTAYRLRRLFFSLLFNFAIKRRQDLYILSRIKILPFSSIQTHGHMTPFVVNPLNFDLSSTVVCKE